jgi:hypothetical protein
VKKCKLARKTPLNRRPKRRKSPMKAAPRQNGKLMRACDAVWSRLVKARADHRCEVCGAKGTEAHHLIGRVNKATRYAMENGLCLCSECHRLAHGPFRGAFLGLLGWDRLDWMDGHDNATVRADTAWYEAQLERLRELERA